MNSWLIWCDLNYEQDALEKLFGDDCVSIRGNTPNDLKIEYEERWRNGKVPVLITKPSVFGYGMNWQHCSNVIFYGLSNSYEMYYQAIRRTWRFGQTQQVNVYVVVSSADGAIVENIRRKEQQASEMFDNLVKHMAIHTDLGQQTRHEMDYNPQQAVKIPTWLRKPVQTKTEPGMWWIDLNSIPYQWAEAPKFNCGVEMGNQAVMVPNWIQGVI